MVQFLAMTEPHGYHEDGANVAIEDSNSYWKLGLRKDKKARNIIEYLKDQGYRCRDNASRAVALDAVGRLQRGLMSYEGLSVPELQSLCRAKGLSSKAKTASRLARALEKADDNATFRFLDLPAEFRNMIYEFYISDLPDIRGLHKRPPSHLFRECSASKPHLCSTVVRLSSSQSCRTLIQPASLVAQSK